MTGHLSDAEFRRRILDVVGERDEPQGISIEIAVDVAAFLLVNPKASANSVDAYVTGRRSLVLSLVKKIQERARSIPGPGNQVDQSSVEGQVDP